MNSNPFPETLVGLVDNVLVKTPALWFGIATFSSSFLKIKRSIYVTCSCESLMSRLKSKSYDTTGA